MIWKYILFYRTPCFKNIEQLKNLDIKNEFTDKDGILKINIERDCNSKIPINI